MTTPSSRPTISLCLIVKDEEPYLENCVMSARPAVDEVVIVDTGSVDRTPQLARGVADVYAEHEFGDFAQARNEALRYASGDWVFFLDADEQLSALPSGTLHKVLADAPSDVLGMTMLRYNFFGNGGFYTNRALKLHRHCPAIRFERPINESVAGSIALAGGRVAESGLLLNHFGHCRSLRFREQKAERYLTAFRAEHERDEADAFYPAYRALILRALGRFTEAMELADVARSRAPDSPLIATYYGHVVRALGDHSRTLRAYQAGLALAPEDPTLLNMVGVTLLSLGRHDEAAERFTEAAARDPAFLHPEINLGLLAQAEQRWGDAERHFRTAYRSNPAFGHLEWSSHLEPDYFRCTHFETPFGYHGLGYHLAYVSMRGDDR